MSSEPSEPLHSTAHRNNKDVIYWIPNIDKKITPEVRQLLEQYAGIPWQDVLAHCYIIREKAWQIRSYPCTGMGAFFAPTLNLVSCYSEILDRVKQGQRFMDIGAYVGTDLRKLVFDGALSDNLVAVDIVSHWNVGYDLFRDRDRFAARFLENDILRPYPPLQALAGSVDIIWINKVVHQWSYETQLICCCNLVRLSSPRAGSLVVGMQAGTLIDDGREMPLTDGSVTANYFSHSTNTWAEMWVEVGRQTGTRWACEARMREWDDVGLDAEETRYLGEDSRMLEFVMRRLL